MTQASDEQLFAAYVSGDEDAFEELFRRYAPVLVRLFHRDVFRPQDADELVQETFLRAHRAAADFKQGLPLRPWLLTIAMNLKREYFRRKARKPEAVLELDGRRDPVTEAPNLDGRDAKKLLSGALTDLPESQREVIELHWFSEVPFQEIARMLGISASAAKVRAHRGYKSLREKLEGAW